MEKKKEIETTESDSHGNEKILLVILISLAIPVLGMIAINIWG